MNSSPRALVAVLAVAGLLGTAACTSDSKSPKSSAPSSSSHSSSSGKPTPGKKRQHHHHQAGPPHNPYTGLGPVPKTPVISVKIDDTAPGRPQVNIDKADIVYVEAVEGGLTRLAAIYGTNKPTVGYVRSTRPSDPDLLLQFGKITAAYSGGAHDSLPRIYASGIKSWSNDAGAAYYFRASHTGDEGYINVELDLAKVAKATHTNRPRSIGWTFARSYKGISTRKGTDVRTVVTGSYSTGTPVEFRWDKKLKKYVRYIGGVRQHAADGNAVTAANVIVQSCKVLSHPADTDVNGNPSQFTVTVGHGPVSVFRDGRRIDGTWVRKGLHHGTIFRTKSGKLLPLHPGNSWVVLIRKGVAVSG